MRMEKSLQKFYKKGEQGIMKINEDYSLTINTEINAENIRRALKVLTDNGIDPDEAGVVLEAIGYTLLDVCLDTDGMTS